MAKVGSRYTEKRTLQGLLRSLKTLKRGNDLNLVILQEGTDCMTFAWLQGCTQGELLCCSLYDGRGWTEGVLLIGRDAGTGNCCVVLYTTGEADGG